MDKKNPKKKVKLKFTGIILLLIIFSILGLFIYKFLTRRITNIYVSGNDYLSDWDVIVEAKLDNYPISIQNTSPILKKRLKRNILIRDAKIYKKGTSVYIEIDENRPIFYDNIKKKTVLTDSKTIDQVYDVPLLDSEISVKMYNTLLNGLSKLKKDVLIKISEITYSPDSIDTERFVLTMTDGNYVYITLKKINLINDYMDIVKEFGSKKGILYLNSGGYFKIMEN